ncbi:CCA tRNA nucleotidyltransferase [Methanogenium organophilum]|uniref:CCA-adding enzyme n=1 Tax=Methanogenium organophilum TaxID=2199 RepID=A0A9X9T791_METOG|nr:CCA tRNA nucleotidyltransferase [Methanogenium organophilum]WAI00804.1 CCA tRNA nucleotidyltransferase [Methanogenium organophilum]
MTPRNATEKEVLSVIRPEKEERDDICTVAEMLVKAVNESGTAKGMVVGSVARNTWISGDRDIDVFMLFPPELPRESLEEEGIVLGRSIASRFGGKFVEKYAEHPYINTTISGFDVDLVPCYAVTDAARIQSAVDRTPFHTRYIQSHISGLEDDVLLMKQFSKAGGVYGSDLMTEGFAGYLCELLVLTYGGFSELIEACKSWQTGKTIDIAGHQGKHFDDPLVVIDPVDPNRNVAASVSLAKMGEFIELCRGYFELPGKEYFFPPVRNAITRDEFELILAERGTGLYSISFATPHQIPDIVVPQLRRSTAGIAALLERHGFVVNRYDAAMGDDRCYLLFELLVDHLPPLYVHTGPPVENAENAGKFREKYLRYNVLSGPFINGDGRYAVEILRKWVDAYALLASDDLFSARLGKHVVKSMKKDCDVRCGAACWDENICDFLSAFFNKISSVSALKKL